jgi:hypothetical protein
MTSPNTLANSLQTLQIQQDPKPGQQASTNTPNNAAIPNQTSQIPVHQATPVFIPLDSNQTTNFDGQNNPNGQDVKLTDEYNIIQPNESSPKPVTLPSNQSPMNFDQHDQKPMVTSTAGHITQPDKSLLFNSLPAGSKSPTSFDQKIGHNQKPFVSPTEITQPDKSMVLNNPFSSPAVASNPPPTNVDQQTGYHQKSGMVIPPDERINHPKKSSSYGQFNAPSNRPPTNFGQHDQKSGIMVHSEVHQPNKSLPNSQYSTPSHPLSTGFDQSYPTHTTTMSISSTNDTQDISPYDIPSAVPPLLIPLSKVGQYLPEGMAMVDSKTWIPLALKPVIVLKDQVAVMVFEQDDG